MQENLEKNIEKWHAKIQKVYSWNESTKETID